MDEGFPEGIGGLFPSMLNDLLKLMRTDSPVQWDLAVQLAHSIAAEAGGDTNPDPVQRMELEELARLAELHVADVTGLVLEPGGRHIEVLALGPAEFARRTLETWRPFLTDLAGALAPAPAPPPPSTAEYSSTGADLSGFLAQWAGVLAPAMAAMQFGSIVGHLSERSLGAYDLPLARPGEQELLVVVANLARFAEEWSLPVADVELYCLVRDFTLRTVCNRPGAAAFLIDRILERARHLSLDATSLTEQLGGVGPAALGDLGELSRILGDGGSLASLEDTPERRRLDAEIRSASALLIGYAEYVTAKVAERAIGSGVPVREAMRRARLERGEQARAAEEMLGLSLDETVLDDGEAFCVGVIERGGELELSRAWREPELVPTPAELVAPGLWLERVRLPAIEP